MLAEIGILLLLVLANVFFAGAEMAVVAVSQGAARHAGRRAASRRPTARHGGVKWRPGCPRRRKPERVDAPVLEVPRHVLRDGERLGAHLGLGLER